MRHLALVLLAACAGTPHLPIVPQRAATAADALVPPPPTALRALLAPEPAAYWLRYPPTPCVAPGRALPFLACEGRPPRVGEPWRLTGWTHSDPRDDASMVWLVVAWRRIDPVNVAPLGAPGCYLLADLESVVAVPPSMAGGLVERSVPGRFSLAWTPPASAAGRTVWFQPLVWSDANDLHLVTGPALEARVGL